jgi:hypothetical protein
MPSFSRDKSRRDLLIALRVSRAEADVVDELAARLGLKARSDVLRAGLDLLLERHPPPKPKG